MIQIQGVLVRVVSLHHRPVEGVHLLDRFLPGVQRNHIGVSHDFIGALRVQNELVQIVAAAMGKWQGKKLDF